MITILSLAVAYCIAMTVVCGRFAFNKMTFTGFETETRCYPTEDSNWALAQQNGVADVSLRFQQLMIFGFATHLFGILCDSMMIARVKVINKDFNLSAVILTSIYTVLFIIWLVLMHVFRYNASGRRCAGDYIVDMNPDELMPHLAIRQA